MIRYYILTVYRSNYNDGSEFSYSNCTQHLLRNYIRTPVGVNIKHFNLEYMCLVPAGHVLGMPRSSPAHAMGNCSET